MEEKSEEVWGQCGAHPPFSILQHSLSNMGQREVLVWPGGENNPTRIATSNYFKAVKIGSINLGVQKLLENYLKWEAFSSQ